MTSHTLSARESLRQIFFTLDTVLDRSCGFSSPMEDIPDESHFDPLVDLSGALVFNLDPPGDPHGTQEGVPPSDLP